MRTLILFCITLIMIWQPLLAQDPTEATKVFSIENCVSKFSMQDTLQTKSGYQFWFVDKEFLDGRTLKMSVVGPYLATHLPHQHIEDEFFFVL